MPRLSWIALSICFATSFFSNESLAGLVVGYDVLGGSELSAVNGSNVTGVNLTRGGGATDAGGGSDFATANWTTSSYLQFGFTSTVAYDLTNVRFSISGDAGVPAPNNFKLQVAVNGGAFSDLAPSLVFDVSSNSDVAFTNVSSLTNVDDVLFRLVSETAPVSGGEIRLFDVPEGSLDPANPTLDFIVEGVAVPEPSSGLLLVAFGAGLSWHRRRD
ncbi:MAG TPA: hypothetical protein DDW52_21795 [Planctomycetaceae bacterium]|nr:hypothetical protein [Planctomycetaceae bacterium]